MQRTAVPKMLMVAEMLVLVVCMCVVGRQRKREMIPVILEGPSRVPVSPSVPLGNGVGVGVGVVKSPAASPCILPWRRAPYLLVQVVVVAGAALTTGACLHCVYGLGKQLEPRSSPLLALARGTQPLPSVRPKGKVFRNCLVLAPLILHFQYLAASLIILHRGHTSRAYCSLRTSHFGSG